MTRKLNRNTANRVWGRGLTKFDRFCELVAWICDVLEGGRS